MIDSILHFIMISKLKYSYLFTAEGCADFVKTKENMSELDQEFFIALMSVVVKFNNPNLIITVATMDIILHFIMMSKLKHSYVFTNKWKAIWESFTDLTEIDQEYILSLRTVTRIFDMSK